MPELGSEMLDVKVLRWDFTWPHGHSVAVLASCHSQACFASGSREEFSLFLNNGSFYSQKMGLTIQGECWEKAEGREQHQPGATGSKNYTE